MQCILNTVNGITLSKSAEPQEEGAHGANIDTNDGNSIIERSNIPVANIYFKLQHVDVEQT